MDICCLSDKWENILYMHWRYTCSNLTWNAEIYQKAHLDYKFSASLEFIMCHIQNRHANEITKYGWSSLNFFPLHISIMGMVTLVKIWNVIVSCLWLGNEKLIWNVIVSCLWLGNANKVHPLPTTTTIIASFHGHTKWEWGYKGFQIP